MIEIAHTRSLAKQIGILFTYFWIIIMIRQYRACFILLCLKMGAYFQDVFELNTASTSFFGFAIPHLVADRLDQTDRKFGYMHLVR